MIPKPPKSGRFTPLLKFKIAAAVRSGSLTKSEACHAYRMSKDELAALLRVGKGHSVATFKVGYGNQRRREAQSRAKMAEAEAA